MATMQWTTDQQKVIDLRNRNILVSAAAGSGKTAVLVERIITMITKGQHPIDIDRLLIVTFTNAAAAEMRERIGKAIEKKLSEQPNNIHLQKQMTLLHNAQITTIHSFCLNTIRNHFNVIDIDPGFRIGDEAELKLLKSDVLGELLEKKYEEGKEDFLEFVESYSTGKSDDGLEDIVLQLHGFSMSYPWPAQWLDQRRDAFHVVDVETMEETEWMGSLKAYIRTVGEDLKNLNFQATEICRETGGPYPYLEALEEDNQVIYDLLKANKYLDYHMILENIKWKRLSVKKDPAILEDKKNLVKLIRDRIKTAIKDLKKNYFFQSPEEMLKDIQGVEKVMNALVSLTIEFGKDYQLKKEEKNIVDFNDLEHFALNILVKQDEKGKPISTYVAVDLSEFYEEILVDEYQDSNLVQETILNSISKEKFGRPNLFMVGDVKQSIYKFRLARPELFMDKFRRYDVEDSLYQRIDLHKNFRSRGVVLDFVNCIFRQIMTMKLGNIAYDEKAALHVGAKFEVDEKFTATTTEMILVTDEEEPQETEMGVEDEELSLKELEARVIGNRIKELVQDEGGIQILGKTGYKKARYKDIVILLRTMSGWADVFSETLMADGIPSYADTQTGYFSAIEVKTVLNLLKIIDNPKQDIPITAVLRSPMFSFLDEDLAIIKEANRPKDMYDCLVDFELCENNQELREKVDYFLQQLQEFRSIVPYTKIHDLIVYILEKTGYGQYISVMPGGIRRSANLDMLLQKAITFETTSFKGLFHFNRYIEKLEKYDIDFGEAAVMSENEDAVRIMSIHKSKGLEFPIVFVSGLGKNFNNQDARSKIILHPDYGIGPDYIDYNLRMKSPTLIKKIMQKKTVLENLGEELRILYVALTRAKEKLILTGTVKGLSKKMDKWKETNYLEDGQMMFQTLSTAGSFLDWVVPAVLDEQLLEKEKVAFVLSILGISDISAVEVVTQVKKKINKEELLNWDVSIVYDEELGKELESRLEFVYPFEEDRGLPGKLSVSELKKLSQKAEDEPGEELHDHKKSVEAYIPDFMRQDQIVSGTDRGTLYHKVMECLEFVNLLDEDRAEVEIEKLILAGKIKEEEKEEIDNKKISQFLQSDLAIRMGKAKENKQLFREQPFVIGIPAKQVNSMVSSEENILVQGIIDAYFQEEGELVLVDYKTDQVSNEKSLVTRYKTQLDYYKTALEQLTHKKVKESYIYSFYFRKAILVG
jgi:ATP-dependent helicase/nuclease subunit A